MMAVGLHSALAIKRQRKRRTDQKRAKDRRYSSQSAADSSFGSNYSMTPRGSIASTDGRTNVKNSGKTKYLSTGVVGSVSTFHIGVVFVILGLFLIVSSVVPDYITDDWGELLGTGIFFLCCGIFLIVLNRLLTKHEDEVLFQDVQNKLSRSRSGQRLFRDPESGQTTTISNLRAKEDQARNSSATSDSNDTTRVLKSPEEQPNSETRIENGVVLDHNDVALDRIVEECEIEHHGNSTSENGTAVHCISYNSNESNSLSPNSLNETQGLLESKRTSRV